MIFNELKLLIPILIVIILFCFITLRTNSNFFKFIEDYWFFKKSKYAVASNFFYLLGVILILISLLDLRGHEESITGKTSDKQTMIMIDSSASMLSEDVRPNRFQKAILLARHYVKKAVGQKIAISVFSDSQKILVPFTDDYDLIQARLGMLETLQLGNGGTSLNLAIQESVQYFKSTSKEVVGNILIFTDAEETDGAVELKLPEGINIGIVGVGTAKGGLIPTRNARNEFIGNKTHKGSPVVTKLDESYLKKLSTIIKDYKYWIATSYTLPTEEIINFFNRKFDLKQSKKDYKIRPVLFYYTLIPGILILIISFLLKFKKTFIAPLLLILTFNSYAVGNAEEKKPVKSEQTKKLEDLLAKGELEKEGSMALASSLLKDGFSKDAENLYEENIEKEISEDNIENQFNLGTAKLKNQNVEGAIDKYKEILDFLDNNKIANENLEKELKLNILKALKSSSSGKGKGEGKDKNKDKDDSKDKNKDKSDEGEKSDNKDDKQNNDEKNDKEDQNKDNENNEKDSKPKNENEQEKKDRQNKIPALLKQLINDDNQLQKKLIDGKTTKRKKSEAKDW